MTDFISLQKDVDRIFEILSEHKLREEQLTKTIHKQSEEIEMMKRKLKDIANQGE